MEKGVIKMPKLPQLISEEAAVRMLTRISLTPDEARRCLTGTREECEAIMKTVQERVKREQNKFAPFDPRDGPPLPRVLTSTTVS